MTTPSTIKKRYIHEYSHIEPLPDAPREHDMVQRRTLSSVDGMLLAYFAGKGRDDVLITGEIYLLRSAGDSVEVFPDCIFAVVDNDPEEIIWRNGYVIDEVGKPPDFVLEVGSRSTGELDYTVKRERYAAFGVGEYWRFDPSGGEYHDAPLAGDVLAGGEYERLEIVVEPDGRHWGYSAALGLELWWEEKKLRFRDPVSGEFLPTPEELQAIADSEREIAASERMARMAIEDRIDSERMARFAAQARADAEEAARLAAEERIAAMEAELRRLRSE